MNVQNETLLNPKPGDPNGYITKDLKWAAVPWGTQFVVICNGQQVHTAKTLTLAKDYIKKKVQQTPRKRKTTSSLEEYLID